MDGQLPSQFPKPRAGAAASPDAAAAMLRGHGGLRAPRAMAWAVQRPIALFAPVFFLVYAFVFVEDGHQSAWFHPYVIAANRMQAGQRIHVLEKDAYAYPPAMAMLAVPLADLPWRASLWCWYLVNVAAAAIAFTSAWRLAGAKSLVCIPPLWQATFGLTLLASLRFFGSPLENTQFDMVIAALLFAGCLKLAQGRDLDAGALLGAAAAMKLTPLLFGPYLLWRGRWRALAPFAAVPLVLNLLPDLLFPQTNGHSYLLDWCQTFLQPVAATAPGEWHSDMLLNQSLSGMFYRWHVLGLPITTQAIQDRYALPAAPAAALRWLVYGACLLLLAISAWRLRRNSTPTWKTTPDPLGLSGHDGRFVQPPDSRRPTIQPSTDQNSLPWASLRTSIEAATLCMLMLLLSPMTSKAHFVLAILPVLLVARRLVERRSVGWAVLFTLLLLTGPLCAKDLIGKTLGDLSLAYGMPTWYVLACLAGTWALAGLLRRETASAAPA